ncbi:MAG: hypothetical protein KF796_06340 [Ramlibacter sp.]|nr:hypothetical protein [Ramlibacter sp.]
MSETDFAEFGAKTQNDRTVMHVLYGLHTLAPFTLLSLSVVALIVNYVRRGEELDALYVLHHGYMIRTFWWALLWLAVTAPLWLLFVLPGAAAYTVIALWYLYRYIRGWLRFSDNKPV